MKRKKNENLIRSMNGHIIQRAEEGQGDSRQVQLSFSSEDPYKRLWWTEILDHADGAVDLSRLEDIGVLLFNHDPNRPVGKIVDVGIDSNAHRGVATVQFDDDQDSDTIYQKVLSGTLKGVSVGYRVAVWETVNEGKTSTDGRFTGPCDIARKWTPYEISIVSVPADATVGVNRELEGGENRMDETNQKVKTNMGQPTGGPERRNDIPVTATDQTDRGDSFTRTIQAERDRVTEIMNLCRNFDISPDEYIQKGATVDSVRAAVLQTLATRRVPEQVSVVTDEMDKFRAAATDGLALRAGVRLDKPADGAMDFRGKRLLRLAAECIEREKNVDTRGMDDEMLVREALTPSSAFSGILSNVANKSMAQAYQVVPTTFQLWTGVGTNSDFKVATRYRISEADELLPMTENGEFKDSTLTEGAATTVVGTYGRSFSITRKAIINDDLGALSQIPAKYGAAARRGINKLVYKILTTNPTIEKAKLFSETHGNLTAQDITVAGLGVAKALMARQKNIGGKEALNVQPAYLIVPPELEVTAVQLISSVVDPTKNNATPNPFANRLTVVADPELTNEKEWYLTAAPMVLPGIEVTYLNGKDTPTMESAIQFDTLGIKWRIYMDFGVNLIDFRGLLKSTGAAEG